MTDRSERRAEIRRRAVLASAGLLTGSGALPLVGGATQESESRAEYSAVQDGRCIEVVPLSGSEPVEAFYDYRLPERYVSDENGARAGDSLQYASAGTRDLQRDGTSLLFLYDGPEGLSLVVVHGSVDGSGGGAATFDVSGLPDDGRWVVRDDLYRDPETGEIAGTNYDRWSVEGEVHTVDWTWGGKTDGGAFRDLGDDVAVTIAPAFNEAAALYGEHYEGTVSEWQLLTATGDGLRRISLDMTTPVEIRTGGCATSTPASTDEEIETEDGDTAGDDAEAYRERDEGEDEEPEEPETRRERVKHRKKQRKHEKQRIKHRKKRRKHRRKQRKHRKKQRIKHEKKQRKHRKKRRKHEKD